MPKILHVSDVHLMNLKRHDEHLRAFDQLYREAIEHKPDVIVVAGDVYHSKVTISPEAHKIVGDFLRKLTSIAEVYLIAGNHDMLANRNREDSLTPIVSALNLDKLHYLKYSQEYEFLPGYVFNVMSIVDRENWKEPTDSSKVNIGLFHGPVSGTQTDAGWIVNSSHAIDISRFSAFDYVLLGDIHRAGALDEASRICYSGAFLQGSHGETNDKGYLIWDIKDKHNFSVTHHLIENTTPFVTVELDESGSIVAAQEIPTAAHVRVVARTYVTLDKMRKALDYIKTMYHPEELTFINKANNIVVTSDDLSVVANRGESLRDVEVQERMMREYLRDYSPDQSTLESIFNLNRKYNQATQGEESSARNIRWTVKKIEWDNLFNYGAGNYINYDELEGIVGIPGRSFSGKTSIVDSLIFIVFNTTSKNERKNVNVINQHKDSASGTVWLSANGVDYRITRKVEKYVKRLHGVESIEAKTEVDFVRLLDDGQEISQNGESRSDTDKNIRAVFGTVDDFFLTGFSSQHHALAYIFEGSTKRKEILARFLDLDGFEKKFKMAKEDSATIKGALKRVEGVDYDSELKGAQAKLVSGETEIDRLVETLASAKKELAETTAEIGSLKMRLASIPLDVKMHDETEQELDKKQKEYDALKIDIVTLTDRNVELSQLIEKLNHILDTFDIRAVREKKDVLSNLLASARALSTSIAENTRDSKENEKKIKLLATVPCGTQYPGCKFIKGAFEAQQSNQVVLAQIRRESEGLDTINRQVQSMAPDTLESLLDQYSQLAAQKTGLEEELDRNQIALQKDGNALSVLFDHLASLRERIERSKADLKLLNDAKELFEKLNKFELQQSRLEKTIKKLEEQQLSLARQHGSMQGLIVSITERKNEREKLRQEYVAYDLFMRCMHSNGISYDIIKSALPVLNDEVAKVLANIVDFEVFFENNDDRLEILIKHPKHEPRPIEMGSGAEKTIAAMAIRIALIKIGSLSSCDIFVMDEPATGLDDERMDGFIRALELLKVQFRLIVLISHLDSLKDVCDSTIFIDKLDGYAHVST